MKRVSVVLALVCFGMFVLGAGVVHAEPTAFIVGWGSQVVVDPSVFDGGLSAIAGGYEHSLGLKPDGAIVAWGGNDDGQCDVPAPNTDFVAVAGGV